MYEIWAVQVVEPYECEIEAHECQSAIDFVKGLSTEDSAELLLHGDAEHLTVWQFQHAHVVLQVICLNAQYIEDNA